MRVVFELEKIAGGVFEEKRAVFDLGAALSVPGLLIERQAPGLGPIRQDLPIGFEAQYEAEVARIDALLPMDLIRRQMGYELMAGQA
ncbi:MAG: hypothetical protein U0361_24470, partial [Nitrospiraceae bacterium]